MDPNLYCCVRVLYCVSIINHLRVLGDGGTIVCNVGRKGKLLFCDTDTGKAFRPVSGITETLLSGMEVLSDGLTVVTSDFHGNIMLWNYQHMRSDMST
jgi:hypothetical protein